MTNIDTNLDNVDKNILEWLLEDTNPEVKLRVLTEYLGLNDNQSKVTEAKQSLINSAIFSDAVDRLNSDKKWSQYDALASFAEWGLTRNDIPIDNEVYDFIEKVGFQPLCGEAFLLRNLVKLGYYNEPCVETEVNIALHKIKEDGGFGCLSKNKKINDPKLPHKSCMKITSSYLLLIAEMKRNNIPISCEKELIHYFLKRNLIFRTDDLNTIVVEGMDSTYYPPDAIKTGIQNILYSLCILGVGSDERCKDGWEYLYKAKEIDETYLLGKTKTKPSFNVGKKGKKNKWVTLYALMCEKIIQEEK